MSDSAQPEGLRKSHAFAHTVSFVLSLLSMITAGTIYLFSLYSTSVSQKLSYNQTQAAIIASCGGYGLYLSGPLAGALADSVGPRIVLRFSSLLLFAGYSLMALAYDHWSFVRTEWWAFAAYFFLVGLGSSGAYNSALATNMRNFDKKHHGFAVGFSVAFVGLSAFIFSLFSPFFYIPADDNDFELKGGGVPIPEGKTLDTFRFLLFLAISCAVLNLIASLGLQDFSDSRNPKPTESIPDESTPLLHGTSNPPQSSTPSSDYTREQVLRSPDSYLLFFSFLIQTGTGLMVINNIGAIVLALVNASPEQLGPKLHALQSFYVSLLSVCNALGRVTTGVASDFARRTWGTQRTVFFLFACSLMVVGNAVGAFGVESLGDGDGLWSWPLGIATTLIGLAYGAVFATAPASVGAMFGTLNYGSIWGMFQWGPALGGQTNNLVFGVLYDANREPEETGFAAAALGKCIGPKCFQGAFYWTTATTALTVVLASILVYRRWGRGE
ncbi:major facilitator superfamily domain-containing protein [Cladochytrium replicatum]|nr:major facilitator superfamily domain-containing protein [Cladochytrium replicatum]